MSVMRRLSQVIEEKINAILGQAEDPTEALDLSYQKQLEALQQVRRNVADVLTSEKRLELQAAQLQQSQQKLQGQAQQALQQGREDLARQALTRAQLAQTQVAGLQQQIQQLKDQEQRLEVMAQKLQAKVEAFRTQKETIKAQYSAAEASTKIGEAVTGLSEQMADVTMMVDRAQEKTQQMQARAAAIDQLVDTGVLDQIGAGGQDELDRQLSAGANETAVEAQLQAMKSQLAAPVSPAQLPAGSIVARIQGEDQYRLPQDAHDTLETFDQRIAEAISANDESAFRSAVSETLSFVRTAGQRLPHQENSRSDVVLPSEDMTLEEARSIMHGGPATVSPGRLG